MSPRLALLLLRVQAVLVSPILDRWAWSAQAMAADPVWDDHGLFPGLRGSA